MSPPVTAVPRAGATLATSLGPWAHRVLDSYDALLARASDPDFDRCTAIRLYMERYAPVVPSSGIPDEQALQLAAAATLSTFLVAIAGGRSVATLADSERWFFGGEPALAGLGWASAEVTEPLISLGAEGLNAEILPHIFEVFVTGPIAASRSAKVNRRNNRKAKRRLGAFYTPADVAEYVCESVLDRWHNNAKGGIPNLLDPSCGTGSFLLSALKVLDAKYGPSLVNLSHLYGLDINPAAVQAARFSLVAAQCRYPSTDITPADVYFSTEKNFLVDDALQVFPPANRYEKEVQTYAQLSLTEIEPPQVHGRLSWLNEFPSEFDLLVGNPPYSSERGGRGTAYLPFVRMMWEVTAPSGSAGLIVPLSIAYNTSRAHTKIRNEMSRVNGHWRMAFFDRTPDSLFGDDVKTRNAILLLDKDASQPPRLDTTSLIRWSSRSRPKLFDSLYFAPSSWSLVESIIPKLGTAEERRAYAALRKSGHSVLGSEIATLSRHTKEALQRPEVIHYSSTAYNWIPVYRYMPQYGVFRRGYWSVECKTSADADVLFAVSSSRLTYWLWRVEGDGFHLPKHFVMGLPFTLSALSRGAYDTLRTLANRLWSEIAQRPVHTRNAGQVSLSLSPVGSEYLLDQIDVILCRSLGLDESFPGFIRQFAATAVAAGRNR